MWDERIDDVARRLTDASPPGDLRARILLRIEEGNRARTQRAVWRLAPVAAAIAVIVLIALRVGWHSRVTTTSTRPLSAEIQREAADTTPTVANAAVPAPGPTDTVTAAATAARTKRRAPTQQEQTPDFIERLAVAPLAVAGVRVEGIAAPERIEPRALDLSALSMTPLGTEERPHN